MPEPPMTPPARRPADILVQVSSAWRAIRWDAPETECRVMFAPAEDITRVAEVLAQVAAPPPAPSRDRHYYFLQSIIDLAEEWDEDGPTGPRSPLSWETVARMSMDYAKAALEYLDAAAPPAPALNREALGRKVREVWVAWAREQPSPKPSWLAPWEELSESDREVDRRIGETLAGLAPPAPAAPEVEAEIAAWLDTVKCYEAEVWPAYAYINPSDIHALLALVSRLVQQARVEERESTLVAVRTTWTNLANVGPPDIERVIAGARTTAALRSRGGTA